MDSRNYVQDWISTFICTRIAILVLFWWKFEDITPQEWLVLSTYPVTESVVDKIHKEAFYKLYRADFSNGGGMVRSLKHRHQSYGQY